MGFRRTPAEIAEIQQTLSDVEFVGGESLSVDFLTRPEIVRALLPAELSYEQAREELMRVVQRLESGGAPLDESLALWERGEELATVCQRWLDGAKAKIDAARTPASPD